MTERTQKYHRPPIVEAVVEVRFDSLVPVESIEKSVAKLSPHYSKVDHDARVDAQFRFDGKEDFDVKGTNKIDGRRMVTTDQLEVLVVHQNNFVSGRLAPYPGWDEFFERFARDWEIWRSVIGHQKLNRLGLRFINRIDIPKEETEGVEISRYLNAHPNIPGNDEDLTTAFTMQYVKRLSGDNAGMKVTVGTVDAPAPQFISVSLDIDVVVDSNVPSRQDDVLKLLERMRSYKNDAFESCITDEARRLFGI